MKNAGVAVEVFEGVARVFDREQAAMDALEDGTICLVTSSSFDTKAPRVVRVCARC